MIFVLNLLAVSILEDDVCKISVEGMRVRVFFLHHVRMGRSSHLVGR